MKLWAQLHPEVSSASENTVESPNSPPDLFTAIDQLELATAANEQMVLAEAAISLDAKPSGVSPLTLTRSLKRTIKLADQIASH